jgi:hypothetical protein
VIRHQPRHPNHEVHHPEPHSNVHVLRNDEELRDALRRSARFEQSILDRLQSRADHYEALMASAPITEIGAVSAMTAIVDQEPVDEPPNSA